MNRSVTLIGLLIQIISPCLWAGLLPNGDFKQGQDSPQGWQIYQGQGRWENGPDSGDKVVSVTGTGEDSSYWGCRAEGLESGKTYRISFRARGEGSGGCMIAGPSSVNRDFNPTPQWQNYSYYFTPTGNLADTIIRLGQWHYRGTIWFDDAVITEVWPIHRRGGDFTLGSGESIRQNSYACQSDFGGVGSNCSRCLVEASAGFNSNRWTFGPGQYLIYRHSLPGVEQTQASVKINIGYYQAGGCVVSVSRDGKAWQSIGTLEGLGSREFEVPSTLLPAESLFVKLHAAEGTDATFQIHDYAYQARLARTIPDQLGNSNFLEIIQRDSKYPVEILTMGDSQEHTVQFRFGQPVSLPVRAILELRREDAWQMVTDQKITPANGIYMLSYDSAGTGKFELRLTLSVDGNTVFVAQSDMTIPSLYDGSYGYYGGSSDTLLWWWCEGARKVSRERQAPPRETAKPLRISGARGEYEPVQVVLRPQANLENLSITCETADPLWHDAIHLYQVWYHFVQRATDDAGCVGWWPDALPAVENPIHLTAGQNQPIWVLVKIPAGATKGDHAFNLKIKGAGAAEITIPLIVQVYDFALPRRSSLESAFGINDSIIKRYHNLQTEAELRQVWDLYMQSFRDHRLSPYHFAPLDPIRVNFTGPDDDMKVEMDFTAWDEQARRYLDGYGFSTFLLPLQGMGAGTYDSRQAGRIGPHEQGSAQYRRLFGDYAARLQKHLQENNWLSRAYTYWFDEPEPKDYDFVRAGMDEIKRAAPGLRRMLTEEPLEALYGSTDIWCPILDNYDARAAQARQRQGERIWWYVCTGPKAPWPGLFIDHNAIDLRIWLWMTWKWQVQGILVWESTYWNSDTAFPAPNIQNPWDDPMGYVSGYRNPAGFVGYWGNGDGRFIYPPNRDIKTNQQQFLTGPVSSIRWEMLREGLEDYEYFHLLQQQVETARKKGLQIPQLEQAQRLLQIPEIIIRDKTHFTHDPQPLYDLRQELARMIEFLQAQTAGK